MISSIILPYLETVLQIGYKFEMFLKDDLSSLFMKNIGAQIKHVMKESGVSTQQLAKDIHCHRQNIYKIFDKSDVDTAILRRISYALNHDFFADISAELKIGTPRNDCP